MSTKTHTKDCEKTKHLREWASKPLVGRRPYLEAECTCGAEAEPGVEERLAAARDEVEQLRNALDEARRRADELRMELGRDDVYGWESSAGEMRALLPHPWEKSE